METRKYILRQTAVVALGQVLCTGGMLCVFFLLGHRSLTVLLGGVFGALLATANFFFMALGAGMASEKAVRQDVRGGQSTLRLSFVLRYLLLFVLLFALAKSGVCHPVALVLPLVFVRPTISIAEFFRKPGESHS